MKNTILITGSNGGIGRGVVEYFLENNIRNIACHYRGNRNEIEEILKKYDLSPEKYLFQADLTNEEEITTMRDNISNSWGGVESLINIAGSSNNSVCWKMSKEDFSTVINDNLLSTFLTCKTFCPAMRDNNYGRIINVSSIVGFTGVVGASHYSAAKAGIVAFTKSIAQELINKNITVNALALGYFNAGIIREVPENIQETIKAQIPAKRFGNVDEIASFIKYLISNEASYITGQVHHINGGLY